MSELQQYHLDLKQYERALQVWDTMLQSQEAHVDAMEANLLEFEEDDIECACGFAEMTDGCDCEWCDQLRDEVDSGEGDCATAYYKWSQTPTVTAEAVKKSSPASIEDIQFLDRLFALPDTRNEEPNATIISRSH
jgi:hypothetical protein